jgi:hypothetical protein
MHPVIINEANCNFTRPKDLEEAQCMEIRGFVGQIAGGSMDGENVVVVGWRPSEEDMERLKRGHPIYVSCIGGLPPHLLTTAFEEAVKPA